MLYSSFFGLLTSLTTDHAILLVPSLIVIYFIFRYKTNFWKGITPLIFVTLSYLFWISVKIYIYTNNEYYPAGWDGTIVNTSKWGLKELLSSLYFDEMEIYIPLGYSFEPLHYIYPVVYMLNLVIAPWPANLRFSTIAALLSANYLPQLIIYSALSIGGIYGFYLIIKLSITKKNLRGNGMLLSLILFFIFLFPLTQKFTSTRFTITAIMFLYIIISLGLFELAKKLKFLKMYKICIVALILILFFYLPFYYSKNNYFILFKEKIVEENKTAEFLNQLPKDGIMAQIGYTPELNYLADKRVMALPITPDYMFLVDIYNISYLLYGGFYNKPFSEGDRENTINYDTIKHIVEHPEKFKLLKVVKENYPTINKIDNIYIYEVIH
jgi:hypothetical protein